MHEQPVYPPPPAWSPPPRRGAPAWVWILASCGGFMLMGLVAAGYFAFRVTQTVTTAVSELATESRAAGASLRVVDHKLTTYQGKRYIVGSLKNTSPADAFKSVSIQFALFDKKGQELDEGVEASSDEPIQPGATWRFKVEIEDSEAVKYKQGDVFGFREGAVERVLGRTSQRETDSRAETK